MPQEDKELLLVVLCTMLPYGVICLTDEYGKIHKLKGINKHKGIWWYEFDGFRNIKPPKPYLRPMSSMTEEERKEYERFSHLSIGFAPILMDWIYSHHLDCSGLIEKGLALEAPEGMYNLK